MTKGKLNVGDWVGFIGMAVGTFMAVLDIQIVASSLKEIQGGLSATSDEISWVQTSYLIAEVIMIPLSGWLAKTLSTRYLFAFSCGFFTLMSAGCASAWNLESMIIFRSLQGFAGGAMIPLTFSAVYLMFPPRWQQSMSILVGLIITLAPTVGPVFGGYLTEVISWHAIFLINVVPGILVTITTCLNVDIDKPQFKLLKEIDFKGIIFIALFLGSMQYVLEEGAREDWFESKKIMVLTIIAFVFGIASFYQELTCKSPIVNLRAFKNLNFSLGCFFSVILGVTLFGISFITPLYLGTIKGLNSYEIGVYLMVTGIFQFASGMLAGVLAKRMDLRVMLFLGFSVLGLGVWTNAELTYESGYWDFFWPQALRGAAIMFCFLPINTIALGNLPVEYIKDASSLYNLTRNLGGAIGLAIINTNLTALQAINYEALRNSVTLTKDYVIQWTQMLSSYFQSYGLSDSDYIALKQLAMLAHREASIIAYNDIFIAIAIMIFSSTIVIPFVKKVKSDKDLGAH